MLKEIINYAVENINKILSLVLESYELAKYSIEFHSSRNSYKNI